jgi:hypothetical protein
MNDKVLCFDLNGFTLAVEPDQIEKILINKHPTKDTFTLETGVEVKSLRTYIPLPEIEENLSSNIFFVKDQKDFYGFTIDRINGYLRLRGKEHIPLRKEPSPIKYFIRNQGTLIPVLDLQYITNNQGCVSDDLIHEMTKASQRIPIQEDGVQKEDKKEIHDIDEEEVLRSIDEEIQKNKKTYDWDASIVSEKKGVLLPLVVNLVIIAIVGAGIVYYMIANRAKISQQTVGESISGVEEEVIREIRRRSEAELAEQRKRLEDAKNRLASLQKERDDFLQNQESILLEKEKELNAKYLQSLEEAKNKIAASGVANVEEEFEKERERIYQEFLQSMEDTREETEKIKEEYEEALMQKEESLQQEVNSYASKVREVEQQLVEEQAKLKEAEAAVQSITASQQEYFAFRRQLNSVYNVALGFLIREDYPRGIEELNKIPAIIENAKRKGIGDDVGLEVEENLAQSILRLAEREQNRINLNQIGEKTYEAAVKLEQEGKLLEALTRYHTVSMVMNEGNFRERAERRATIVMDKLFKNRSESEIQRYEREADMLFTKAMDYKRGGEYSRALTNLEEIITLHPASKSSKKSLDEIIAINNLKDQIDQDRHNKKAMEVMNNAEDSYEKGYYAEALSGYEAVVRDHSKSDYVEDALTQILRINEQTKGLKFTPSITLRSDEENIGVVLQVFGDGSLLLNLGRVDNIQKSDILHVFRNEESGVVFIGSLKIYDTNPKTSKGRIIYSERKIKVGDIVALS